MFYSLDRLLSRSVAAPVAICFPFRQCFHHPLRERNLFGRYWLKECERVSFLVLQLSDFAEPSVENCFCGPDAVGPLGVWVVRDCNLATVLAPRGPNARFRASRTGL